MERRLATRDFTNTSQPLRMGFLVVITARAGKIQIKLFKQRVISPTLPSLRPRGRRMEGGRTRLRIALQHCRESKESFMRLPASHLDRQLSSSIHKVILS